MSEELAPVTNATTDDGPAVRASRPEPNRGTIALELVRCWSSAQAAGLLYLCKSERQAEYLGDNIHSLFADCPVLVFPRWDCPPFDPAGPSRAVIGRRSSVLRRLAEPGAQPLVIAVAEAVLQRVPPRRVWSCATLRLRSGEPIAADDLQAFFERTRYALGSLVDEPGEAAVHGSIIDVFPAGALGPVRIELQDGRIASLHSYDPSTQRSIAELSEIILDAASEAILPPSTERSASPGDEESPWLCDCHPTLETLFDYMPDARLAIEPGVEENAGYWFEQIREAYDGLLSIPASAGAPAVPRPDRLYLAASEWQLYLRRHRAEPLQPSSSVAIPHFATDPNPARAYRNFIATQVEAGRRVVITAAGRQELDLMLRRARRSAQVSAGRVSGWREVLDSPAGSLLTLDADFEKGFLLRDSAVAVIAAADLLGSRARHRVPMALPRDPETLLSESTLRIGGPVLHLDHGIGLLRGIETVEMAGTPDQDTLRLEYAGGTVLMVPVQEIGAIWGYGAAADKITLDRLGSNAWVERRAAVENAIAETARRFAALMRERAERQAPTLVPAARDYERFAAGFPFVSTPDQQQAIEEVLADLGAGRPMDRLLCGDVGFGKTEVALRAAAAAALSDKQVAVIVPTTVLAGQHLGIFRRRFAGYGVRVELLSRLAKPAELRAVKQGLRNGTVRIVIGTQAIVAKDVRFKELALLIIDEEQRFGSRIKDKLRAFGQGLHVLTMSATPIPRTMQRAIIGLQSLSTLETPPARRLPIRTVLTRFDPVLVRQALSYERRRGGQSFFVCPRIEDLEPIAEQLRELAPELRLAIAHGKLPAAQIDEIFLAFAGGRGDVLVTTAIVETGLDIPRANTMIIWRPDRFGAAQLHQLRGRVGRGRRRGLAYLLTDPDARLPAATEKRLKTLVELDRLGAGFAVSRRDLDLRGAGELLGEAQTGHIRLLGAELYRHLLDRALAETTAGKTDTRGPEVRLDVPTLIPTDYISEPEIRINLYARLARVHDLAQIDTLADEIEDRFGDPPEPMCNLIASARIRAMAIRLGIAEVDAGPLGVAFTFGARHSAKWPERAAGQPEWHWSGDRAVVDWASTPEDRVDTVLELMERLFCHSAGSTRELCHALPTAKLAQQ